MTLQRRTPLPRGAGMRRGGSLPARRATPRRAGDRLEHGMPWAQVLAAITGRCHGRCEGCGQIEALQGHHRQTRRFGPDCPCNVLGLCQACHHEGAHGEPKAARVRGWTISRHTTVPPASLPVMVHDLGTVYLTCDGQYV